jgi:hypothetical protein
MNLHLLMMNMVWMTVNWLMAFADMAKQQAEVEQQRHNRDNAKEERQKQESENFQLRMMNISGK